MLVALLGFTSRLFAQDAGEVPPADLGEETTLETPAEEEEENGLQVSGYVDAYYQANFSTFGEDDAPLVFPTSFTGQANEFALGMANVIFAKEMGKVAAVAQLGFGPRAEAANGDVAAIQQLFVTYSPSESVTFSLGNFGTFVGYEVIDPVNVNYSTSYLFSNGPFFHMWVKADFALGENFGAMVGLFNDTDSKFDAVGGKHIGGQLSAEFGGLAAFLNVLTGVEEENFRAEEDLTGFQVDLTATYTVSEKLMFGLNASDKTSSVDGDVVSGFTGVAVYSTIGLSDDFALGLRAESFSGKLAEEETGEAPSVLSLTLSGNFTIDDLTFIPEVRLDSGSNGTTFLTDSGVFTGEDSVASFILAAVYSF